MRSDEKARSGKDKKIRKTMHELVLHTEMVCLIIKTKNRAENTESGRRDKA